MDDNLICLGIIVAPHGINGAVKIKTFTEKPEGICLYGPLTDGKTLYQISLLSCVNDSVVIATINNVNSRNLAEELRNVSLYIEKGKLPELSNINEFYVTDMLNMDVMISEKLYGNVKSMHNFGSCDILEILAIETGKCIMLPFTKEIFPYVNVKKKHLVLNIPSFIE